MRHTGIPMIAPDLHCLSSTPSERTVPWQRGDFPLAEEYYAHCLSIPLYPSLTDEQQQYVIDCIRELVQE